MFVSLVSHQPAVSKREVPRFERHFSDLIERFLQLWPLFYNDSEVSSNFLEFQLKLPSIFWIIRGQTLSGVFLSLFCRLTFTHVAPTRLQFEPALSHLLKQSVTGYTWTVKCVSNVERFLRNQRLICPKWDLSRLCYNYPECDIFSNCTILFD